MYNGLPERCYALNAITTACVILEKGMSGYYTTDYPQGYTQEVIDKLNESLGVSKAQAQAMFIGSMFGWNAPGANPEMYDEDGKPIKARKGARK
jgi:hypothetical protein